MYKRLSVSLTDKLIKLNTAEEEKRSIYEYGFQLVFNAAINIISFLVIALIFKKIVLCLFFMVGFFAIRGLSGGFHASSPLKCYILSAASQLFFIAAYHMFPQGLYPLLFSSITPLLVAALFIFAPVDHKNKPFYGTEYTRFKKRSRIYAVILPFFVLPAFLIPQAGGIVFAYLFGSLTATAALVTAKIIRTAEIRKTASEKDA